MVVPSLSITPTPRLREMCWGAWEGLNSTEAAEQYSAEWAAWSRDPLNERPPGGGESFLGQRQQQHGPAVALGELHGEARWRDCGPAATAPSRRADHRYGDAVRLLRRPGAVARPGHVRIAAQRPAGEGCPFGRPVLPVKFTCFIDMLATVGVCLPAERLPACHSATPVAGAHAGATPLQN